MGPILLIFWSQLGSNLAPSWLQVGPQVGPKSNLAELGPNLAPTWPQLGSLWSQLCSNLPPICPNLAPIWLQIGANLAHLLCAKDKTSPLSPFLDRRSKTPASNHQSPIPIPSHKSPIPKLRSPMTNPQSSTRGGWRQGRSPLNPAAPLDRRRGLRLWSRKPMKDMKIEELKI